jgi:hypothetical protein
MSRSLPLAVLILLSLALAAPLQADEDTHWERLKLDEVFRSEGVAVADVNRDGKLDLVVGSTGIAVLIGNGDGTFQPRVSYFTGLGRIYVLRAGDLNGDGKPDLAFISGGAVRVLINAAP